MNKSNESGWISFILGIVNTLGWIVPIVGFPIAVVGIALGAIGIGNKRDRGISIAGMVMNIVFLLASIAKAIVDIVLKRKQVIK